MAAKHRPSVVRFSLTSEHYCIHRHFVVKRAKLITLKDVFKKQGYILGHFAFYRFRKTPNPGCCCIYAVAKTRNNKIERFHLHNGLSTVAFYRFRNV